MTKKEARIKYKKLREQLSFHEIEDRSLAIANKVATLAIWNNNYFHVFLTIDEQKEIITDFILHILAGKDKDVVVSKSNFENSTMTHYLLTDNTRLKKNIYNIPEPIDGIEVPAKKIDVVFVPLLAFDKEGNRCGYGKGFYDKFLAECKPGVLKIGLSFYEAEEKITDMYPGDIKLNYCITPDAVYTFDI